MDTVREIKRHLNLDVSSSGITSQTLKSDLTAAYPQKAITI
jgi:hypothetical protein